MSYEKKIKIGIIGGGPAGIFCALFASEKEDNEIYIFDKQDILKTLLPTGGGRCNLAYGEFDFKELAKNYPRGEKFLLSVFSKFSTTDTFAFFEQIGVKTYMQEDFRFFPEANSSSFVRKKLIDKTRKNNIKNIKEKVIDIKKENDKFLVRTEKNHFVVDKLVIATGGRGQGQKFAKKLGHNIVPLRPALCSLLTKETDFFDLSGLTLKNVCTSVFYNNKKITTQTGDILFTHFGISGPLSYKISSYCAYINFTPEIPLNIKIKLTEHDNLEKSLTELINKNPQKNIINVIDTYIPHRLAEKILIKNKIQPEIKSGQLKKEDRIKIIKNLTEFSLNVIGVKGGEEIVTAGGIDLNEVNPKTMESKVIKNLYFCGEVLDIDGLTGGFNLQNCWSTGYICGTSLI